MTIYPRILLARKDNNKTMFASWRFVYIFILKDNGSGPLNAYGKV